ncbi:MAG: SDR family oxidoreductase [Pelagibacterales bacterium]|nr:SDR family oxidoreductase [Pelagibacterales bacterium]
MLLKNKKVIISAGARGIGWATAKVLHKRGAKIFLCDIDEKRIQKINKDKKNSIRAFFCNADNEKDVKKFFKEVKKVTNSIDCLINNVGVAGPTGVIEKLNTENWDQTLKTNVISHFLFTKNAIPMLKKNKGGSIINISSTAGVFGFPLRSPYAVSKAATLSFTKTAAMELGKYGIRVNAILPGVTRGSRMNRVIDAKAKYLGVSKKSIEKDFVSMASMNSWIEEEDIGKLCSFLMSDDSNKISGQSIAVDGNTLRAD